MSDLIDRPAAIKALLDCGDWYVGRGNDEAGRGVAQCLRIVGELPTVERITGKWIWDDEGYHCSVCFYHAYGETGEVLSGHWHFCPNCGADMRMEEGER